MIFKKSLARKISAVFFAAAVSVSRIFAVPSSTVESDTAALMTALFKDPSGISNVKVNVSDIGEELNASIGTFEDGKDLVGLDKGIVLGTGDVRKIFNSSSGPAVTLLSFEDDNVEATASEDVTEVTSSQGAGTSEGGQSGNDGNQYPPQPNPAPTRQLPRTGGDNFGYVVMLTFDVVPKSSTMDFQWVLASDAWDSTRKFSIGVLLGSYASAPNYNYQGLSSGLSLGLFSVMGNSAISLETNEKFISTADEYGQGLVSYTGRSTVLTHSVKGLTPDVVNHIEITLMVTDYYQGNTYFFIGYNDESDEDKKKPEKPQEPKPEPEEPKPKPEPEPEPEEPDEPEIEKPELEEPTVSEPEPEFDYEPELETTVETVPEPTIYHPETSDNLNLLTATIPVFSSAVGLITSKRKSSTN